ncbi:MAG: helix-hairpin-helix domain-containing protein [Prevotella sp.]|nr:helix-hairpin-helix domain-containing protein [Alistipes senegalensis]MCM1357564.1 helix-hairpin-helix domain-containing protein [Prevotella sp.]
MIIAVVVVIFTAVFVLAPEKSTSEDEITITVMNTAIVTAGTSPTATTTTTSKTTATKITTLYVTTTTKITEIFSETEISSISTSTEPVMASTEPVETVTEQVIEEIFIDINTAGVEELMKLYGIGEVTANEIINYREQNGGFSNIEEIMNVSGIGEVKFANIQDYIYVQNPVYYVDEEPEEPEEIPEPEPEIFQEEEAASEITLDDIAPININTASIEELIHLPSVDEQIAQDIITLREQIHGFSHVYELLYVEKLTQKQVTELLEFVTVGQ